MRNATKHGMELLRSAAEITRVLKRQIIPGVEDRRHIFCIHDGAHWKSNIVPIDTRLTYNTHTDITTTARGTAMPCWKAMPYLGLASALSALKADSASLRSDFL